MGNPISNQNPTATPNSNPAPLTAMFDGRVLTFEQIIATMNQQMQELDEKAGNVFPKLLENRNVQSKK